MSHHFLKGVSAARDLCSEFISIRPTHDRSFRHSSSGLPLLNIDVAFSAFLGTGPALEVIAKILDRGGSGGRGRGHGSQFNQGRGGYQGGLQNYRQDGPPIVELTEREITIIKHKLRGAKVNCLWPLRCEA